MGEAKIRGRKVRETGGAGLFVALSSMSPRISTREEL